MLLSLAAFMVVAHAADQRAQVLDAMARRPGDPWPRGAGHVVLAMPGSADSEKGYHESGGGFSPSFASFGISLWLVDKDGRLVATSDNLPLTEIQERLVWEPRKPVPAIETETPFYRARWMLRGATRWELSLQFKPDTGLRGRLVVRSVGPAGGPVDVVDWDGHRLAVNDRWEMTFNEAPGRVVVGDEQDPNWKFKTGSPPRQTSSEGWAFARCDLASGRNWTVGLRDKIGGSASSLRYRTTRSNVELQLPDAKFVDSVHAQVAHMMMGLSSNETRPGDPNNYPLNWLRDGAYSIVALARAGQGDVARQLCGPFVAQDFFGGFGSEADAPGLAIWAIEETAARVQDAGFDAFAWPAVERKAGLILQMLDATGPVRIPFVGPIVPAHAARPDLDLVCDAARDGLIQGRMDWGKPVLYVNAVSYRGLLGAARFAEARGETGLARSWRERAAALREAWMRALSTPAADNERSYIATLYPTWVLADREVFEGKLQARREKSHDEAGQIRGTPLWTYFNLAESHQWLALGQPERAWEDLRWFRDHQPAPGLYTWWEGNGEENTFQRWPRARGWVKPPNVTPHYWTAAEMLLLQLDMLVMLDESGPQPVVVIGAGVPPVWLDFPLRVAGLKTRTGEVSWEWKNNRLVVRMAGEKLPVRIGPSFPKDAELKVKY